MTRTDEQDEAEWPLIKEIPCQFCERPLTVQRGELFRREGKTHYSYSGPACTCDAAEEARKTSATFNRRVRGS